MGGESENTDRRGRIVGFAGEDDLRAIGRPVGIELLIAILGEHKAGTSAGGRNLIDARRFVGTLSELKEKDCLPVRRPAREHGRYRRIGQLQAFAAIHPAAPQWAVGIGWGGDPLSVFRYVG